MSFFSPNIGLKGRILRGGGALFLLLAAAVLWFREGPFLLILLLTAAGGFTAYEALRGWCVARACGIKTKF
jgi:apolipoprotein N-acyltransferase